MFTSKAIYNRRMNVLGDSELVTINIEARDGAIFVNGREAEMCFNHIQLRFLIKGTLELYIIFDKGKGLKQHAPPKPIAEMYADLRASLQPSA